MLRSAIRNRFSKGPDSDDPSSSDSDDEFHDMKMESSKHSNPKEDELHNTDNRSDHNLSHGGKGSENFSEDSNSNSLSKSKITESSETISKTTSDESPEDESKSFPYSERQIYEMQLVQLQEQLVATMISEQEKDKQLKKYQEVDVEKLVKSLKEEQEKNAELTEKLKIVKNKSQNLKLTRANASKSDPRRSSNRGSKNLENEDNQSEDWIDVSVEMNGESSSQAQDNSDQPDVWSSSSGRSAHPEGESDVGSSAPELTRNESVKDKPDGISKPPPSRFFSIQDYKNRLFEMVFDRLWDFVNEEQESATDSSDEEDSLSVKNLKENINRFSDAIKPIRSFVKNVHELLNWSNIAATSLAFVIYMYAARHGYLFSLLLLIVIWKLFMNYLSAKGIAAHLGLEKKEKEEVPEDKSLSDKFQLVLEVAKKVQNTLGKMANSLEKIKNLLMWQHPATSKLFLNLCLMFIASICLSGPTLFMFMALAFGLRTFVLASIYERFPKVKKRYDGVALIWSELPTDADLVTREENARIKANNRTTNGQNSTDAPSTSSGPQPGTSNQPSQSWVKFCEKSRIPPSEIPLPTWEEGHRCTLLNKDKPLTNMKHGRLYLTQNFLCFEKSKSGSKHIAIRLENIKSVAKYKPINFLPGTGMSIEVEVKGSNKPYIFGALMGRDDLFQSLLMTGRAANYRWACQS